MQIRNNKIDEATLNNYTKELMLCLPDHASEIITAVAEDYKHPIWMVFCGIVLEVHMQGMLSNFTVDPSWLEGIKQYDYVCKFCNKPFKPKNLGQLYCSNTCGEASVVQKPKPVERVVTNEESENDKPSLDTVITARDAISSDDSTDDFSTKLDTLSKKFESGWAAEPDASIPA